MIEIGTEPVVGDEQIGPAVVIVVGGANGKILTFGLVDLGLDGNVGESSVSIVVVENVATVLGNKQVGESVVVVVAPDAAQAVTGAVNASPVGDICKRAIAIVPIKRIADGNATLVQVAAIHKVNVLPAIPVKVGYANSGTKFLPIDGDTVIAFEVHKFDASRCGNVRELNRSRWRRLCI